MTTHRREFLAGAAASVGALAFSRSLRAQEPVPPPPPPPMPAAEMESEVIEAVVVAESSAQSDRKVSRAEWSLNKALFAKKLDNLDFPAYAMDHFGIDAVEYVNTFMKDKAREPWYLDELKKRCGDKGVRSLLIMCDGEGNLGAPDEKARAEAVNNHFKWVDAAKHLGCHSIRVNAASSGSYDEQQKLAADGLRKLCEYADPMGINVIVENHGGLSSDGGWLSGTIKLAAHPRCGTLPDFGNFAIGGGRYYDRYQGVRELMPFAKAVSAKSHDFDDEGKETRTDYYKMLQIVWDAGYRGYVGIEYEGGKLNEYAGILYTKNLLERAIRGLRR
ncbi:MAG: sugar phosphate isomerase/epimerase [Planctomycetes bacterium]|nr:sugar phosphate isomerase/epimerase [Planctomycetota bacterium]